MPDDCPTLFGQCLCGATVTFFGFTAHVLIGINKVSVCLSIHVSVLAFTSESYECLY